MKPGAFFYKAFGLTVCSDMFIMEFLPVEESDHDIRIVLKDPVVGHPQYMDINYSFRITPIESRLYFSGVGEFVISLAKTITIIPTRHAPLRTIELYLSGVVFAVLLYLRGFLVFHGSCIAAEGGGAVALVGDSGMGKSTLAALLQKRGFIFISDDIVALDVQKNAAFVLPAFPMLKIDSRTAQLIDVDSDNLLPVQEGEGKRYLPLCTEPVERDYPLKAICFLGVGEKVSIEKLSTRQFMVENIRYTMPTRLLQQVGGAAHFTQCARVAKTVSAHRLTRTSRLADTRLEVKAVENLVCLF